MKKYLALSGMTMAMALPALANADLLKSLKSEWNSLKSGANTIADKTGSSIANHFKGCKVQVKIKNGCANRTVRLANVNFWHNTISNKYSIPVVAVEAKPGQTVTLTYHVLTACKVPKKADVAYWNFKGKWTGFKMQTFTEKLKEWTKDDVLNIEIKRCSE